MGLLLLSYCPACLGSHLISLISRGGRRSNQTLTELQVATAMMGNCSVFARGACTCIAMLHLCSCPKFDIGNCIPTKLHPNIIIQKEDIGHLN